MKRQETNIPTAKIHLPACIAENISLIWEYGVKAHCFRTKTEKQKNEDICRSFKVTDWSICPKEHSVRTRMKITITGDA